MIHEKTKVKIARVKAKIDAGVAVDVACKAVGVARATYYQYKDQAWGEPKVEIFPSPTKKSPKTILRKAPTGMCVVGDPAFLASFCREMGATS